MDFNSISLLSKYAQEYGHARIREAGVTDTEHKICTFVYFHNGAYQDMIANALMLDKTTVAKALVSLEARGLIQCAQNPENRRKNTLTITQSGKETISDIVGIYDEWLKRVEACLSVEEREQFHSYCRRLLEQAMKLGDKKR